MKYSKYGFSVELSYDDIRKIRFMYANGLTKSDLAKKFNTSREVITNIVGKRQQYYFGQLG